MCKSFAHHLKSAACSAIAALGLTCLTAPLYAQQVTQIDGAALRVLDKLTGEVVDLSMAPSEQVITGFLKVKLNDCRSQIGGRESTEFASLTIWDKGEMTPVFNGWMIANAPALNALDHPRYDVWLLECKTSESAGVTSGAN